MEQVLSSLQSLPLPTLLECLTYLITLLSLPAAVTVYILEVRRLREERRYGTYDALDDKYIEIQTLCLEYPELDVFDTAFEEIPTLSAPQQRQEEALLLIRLSIFERAYLMYQRAGGKIRKSQWKGWEEEIRLWLNRDNFHRVWEAHKDYFDTDFVGHFTSPAEAQPHPKSSKVAATDFATDRL